MSSSVFIIGMIVILVLLLLIAWVVFAAASPAKKKKTYRRKRIRAKQRKASREREKTEQKVSQKKRAENVEKVEPEAVQEDATLAPKAYETPVATEHPSVSEPTSSHAQSGTAKVTHAPMELSPEEAKATALPFQEPVVVRQEDYRTKRYTDPMPETQNIDADCFTFFKGASVLVVEDNLINQKILLNLLKRAGLIVDVANNGKEAVALIDEGKRYDLVIMDISMPVMDGIQATRQIRTKHPELDDMPIITFTAFNLGPEIKKMFEAGANAFLTKPLNISQLYTALTLFVGNPQQENLPFDRMLEIHGLDIQDGLQHVDGNEEAYKERLERFKHRYAMTVSLFMQWLEREDYDRIRLELRDMHADAVSIGAYDLAFFLKDLQKYFIYRTEHLASRQELMFKTRLQTLLDAIDLYLKRSSSGFNER